MFTWCVVWGYIQDCESAIAEEFVRMMCEYKPEGLKLICGVVDCAVVVRLQRLTRVTFYLLTKVYVYMQMFWRNPHIHV